MFTDRTRITAARRELSAIVGCDLGWTAQGIAHRLHRHGAQADRIADRLNTLADRIYPLPVDCGRCGSRVLASDIDRAGYCSKCQESDDDPFDDNPF